MTTVITTNYPYPTFAEGQVGSAAIAAAYTDKYGYFAQPPGGGDVREAMAAARSIGKSWVASPPTLPDDVIAAVDGFTALFAIFGGDTEAIIREKNAYSPYVGNKIKNPNYPTFVPTPRQRFGQDAFQVLVDSRNGKNAVGGPIAPEVVQAGQQFFGTLTPDLARRVMLYSIAANLQEYLCNNGLWHVHVPGLIQGDLNCDNNSQPEILASNGTRDLASWLAFNQQQGG